MRKAILIFITCLPLISLGQIRFSRSYVCPKGDTNNIGEMAIISYLKDTSALTAISGFDFTEKNQSLYLIETDKFGDIINQRFYLKNKYCYEIHDWIKTHNGNYIISGTSFSASGNTESSMFFYLNPNLDTLFYKEFPFSSYCNFYKCIEDKNHDLIFAGTISVSVNDPGNVLLVKTDSIGNLKWYKEYGQATYNEGTSTLIQTPDGGFLMAAQRGYPGAKRLNVYIIKIDSTGKELWNYTYIAGVYQGAYKMITTSDGNYLIAGEACLGPGELDNGQGFLLKINQTGGKVWEKKFGGPKEDLFTSLLELPNRDIIAAGGTNNHTLNGYQAGWLFKCNSNGDSLWSRVIDPWTDIDLFYDIQLEKDGGFLLSGFTVTPGNTTQDAWLCRVDSMGCLQANCFVTGIEDPKPLEDLTVYPNPFNDNLTFSGIGLSLVDLFNLLGEKVHNIPVKINRDKLEISTESLSPGIYFYQICTPQGIQKGKVVKE